jgi:hypothetical protein
MNYRKQALRLSIAIIPTTLCLWIALFTTLGQIGVQEHVSFNPMETLLTQNSSTISSSIERYQFLFESISPNYSLDSLCRGFVSLNSKVWIDGKRIANSKGFINMTEDSILTLPSLSMPAAKKLLQSSICHASSRFINPEHEDEDEIAIRAWKSSLIYLAVHVHQHRHAVAEAQHLSTMRTFGCLDEKSLRKDIEDFDFECPTAKFLVVRLYKMGIGANMRLGVVPALMAGLATDRVVLFVNNVRSVSRYFGLPWSLASCDRRDHQCFFMPSSPCVITQEQLANAHTLSRNEMRHIFRRGSIPMLHEDKRVIVLNLTFRPQVS